MRVVCVHGIGQQQADEQILLAKWRPALRNGLTRAGMTTQPADQDVAMAFYGDLFRSPGLPLAVGDPFYRPADVDEGLETELLLAWWAEAARVDPRVVAPDANTLVRTPTSVQAGLRALSRSRSFAGVALRALVFDLKQIRSYLTDADVRAKARARVTDLISADTQVVVAHSLGSVVAYEALHALHVSAAGHRVRALVTLGSPLGIPNLIFDRLDPTPNNGRGAWPGGDELIWTNVADVADVVALIKNLRPVFGRQVRDYPADNGPHAHDVRAYLTDSTTGTAVAEALR